MYTGLDPVDIKLSAGSTFTGNELKPEQMADILQKQTKKTNKSKTFSNDFLEWKG